MIAHPRPAAADDAALFARLVQIEPASLGHYLAAGAISPAIRALAPAGRDMNWRMVGRALTIRQPVPDGIPVHRALDDLRRGDILVIDRVGDHHIACVGEMVARAAFHAGAAGIVVDGVVTDIGQLMTLGLPVYARGLNVLTTRALGLPGAELFGPVQIGGQVITTGDILFGDANGVLNLGSDTNNLDGLITRALADEQREVEWRQRLAKGESLAQLNGSARARSDQIGECSRQALNHKPPGPPETD